jgi:hypothetical protein
VQDWFDNLGPVFLPYPVNRQHSLNNGRMAWWLTLPGIDGGAHWYDLLGINDGSFSSSGVAWKGPGNRPGGYGALSLNGTSYVSVPSTPDLQLTSSGTLAGWFCSNNAWSTQNPYLFGKTAAAADNVSEYRLEFYSGSLYFTLGNGTTFIQKNVTWAPAVNTWYYIAVTWTGTTTFYINGVQQGAAQAQTTSSYTNTVALQLGNDSVKNASTSRGLNGLVDDLTVYSRALVAAEIRELYTFSKLSYPGVLNRLAPFVQPAAITGPPPTVTAWPAAILGHL